MLIDTDQMFCRRVYDPRFRQLICATGNPGMFPDLNIPKSTIRGWLHGDFRPAVGIDNDADGSRSSSRERQTSTSRSSVADDNVSIADACPSYWLPSGRRAVLAPSSIRAETRPLPAISRNSATKNDAAHNAGATASNGAPIWMVGQEQIAENKRVLMRMRQVAITACRTPRPSRWQYASQPRTARVARRGT